MDGKPGRIPASSEIRKADYAQIPILKLQEENQDSEVKTAFVRLLEQVKKGEGCVPKSLSAAELADFRHLCLEKEEMWNGISED